MMQHMLVVTASASATSANGFFSLKRMTLSDGADTSSVADASTAPKASRFHQRWMDATQSFASTGVLSWNFSPSRSVMSHCILSALIVWPSAICGCGRYLSSSP